jgi:hypothetical protein
MGRTISNRTTKDLILAIKDTINRDTLLTRITLTPDLDSKINNSIVSKREVIPISTKIKTPGLVR